MLQGGDLTVDQLLDYCFALLPSSLGSGGCFWALQCVVSSSHESSLEVRLILEQRLMLGLNLQCLPHVCALNAQSSVGIFGCIRTFWMLEVGHLVVFEGNSYPWFCSSVLSFCLPL